MKQQKRKLSLKQSKNKQKVLELYSQFLADKLIEGNSIFLLKAGGKLSFKVDKPNEREIRVVNQSLTTADLLAVNFRIPSVWWNADDYSKSTTFVDYWNIYVFELKNELHKQIMLRYKNNQTLYKNETN